MERRKFSGEEADAGKAAALGDLIYRQRRAAQQLCRPAAPVAGDVLKNRSACPGLEHRAKVIGLQMGNLRQLLQGQLPGIVILDVFQAQVDHILVGSYRPLPGLCHGAVRHQRRAEAHDRGRKDPLGAAANRDRLYAQADINTLDI